MDEVTRLPGLQELPAALTGALARGGPLTGVFLDIDGFRWVNDQSGHLEGDAVLARLGEWFSRRAAELAGHVFRVAGDEFLLLVPGRGIPEALRLARELVTESQGLGIPHIQPGDPRKFFSLSAVVFPVSAELPENLRAVRDRMAERLYEREMAEGRNYGITTTLE